MNPLCECAVAVSYAFIWGEEKAAHARLEVQLAHTATGVDVENAHMAIQATCGNIVQRRVALNGTTRPHKTLHTEHSKIHAVSKTPGITASRQYTEVQTMELSTRGGKGDM